MTSRITAHIPDAVRGEVARRVDAGEAPSLSAWAAAAVERALDGGAPVDPGGAAICILGAALD